MKKLAAFLLMVCISAICFTQKPAEVFTYYRDTVPNQHVYVQFDKQAYVAGDTAWFKAYLYSNYAPSGLSTNFFIDLVDDNGTVIQSKRYPIFEGTAIGNFDLAANLKQAVYVVRAYTVWSTNLDQSFVFKKAIPVFNPSSLQAAAARPEYSFEFFPEGGRLISDLPNNIAFRAKNQWFEIAPVDAELADSKGRSIGKFANAQGQGLFSFTPVAQEKYFAIVSFPDHTTKKVELPASVSGGATLTIADEENGKSFSALISPGLIKPGESLQLLAVIDNHVVLDTKVPVNNNEALGLIATKNLHPGIMHVFLFDGQGKLLAQRATVVQNQKLSLPVELRLDELGRTAKAKNVFSFLFPDIVTGSFSLSVTDADRELLSIPHENIYSTILRQSGALKQIEQPDPGNEDEADVLAISNRWYGDQWPLLVKRKNPFHFKDKYISLTGNGVSENGSAIVNRSLRIIVQPKNFMQKNYTAELDGRGNIYLDSLIFEDSAKIYYELVPMKKNKTEADMQLSLTEPKIDFSPVTNDIDYSFAKSKMPVFDNSRNLQLAAEIQKDLNARAGISLQPKTVKKDRQAERNDVNKRYATGIFASSTAKTFDYINNPPAHGGINVFESLVGQVGGLVIERVNTGYNLWSSRAVSTYEVLRGNRRGLIPGKVFLNEVETSSDVVMRIPLDQIALVKYYEPGSIMLPGVGASPILAVWTKKQEDLAGPANGDMKYVVQNGYSVTRKFYSPDYSTTSRNTADNRTTLYWDPNISISEDKQFTIEFYNSDTAKRFHIVVEGFTADGKLVHLDRIVELVKGF